MVKSEEVSKISFKEPEFTEEKDIEGIYELKEFDFFFLRGNHLLRLTQILNFLYFFPHPDVLCNIIQEQSSI